jgi:hypothetical protein
MTRCNGCDAEWLGLHAEHCKVCHQTFAGTESGDSHRVGEHDVWSGPLARRCLGAFEMEAGGMWSTWNSRGAQIWHGRVRKDRTARRREVPA